MNSLFLILALCGTGILYYLTVIHPREVRAERVHHRTSLSPEEFYDLFYKDSNITRDAVISVLQFIKENLAMPVDKLRPSDRFDTEYASIETLEVIDSDIDWFWDVTYRKLYDAAQRKHVNLEDAFKQVKTLDEYIKMFVSIETPH
jgi:hypothetical protein